MDCHYSHSMLRTCLVVIGVREILAVLVSKLCQ
jgi:hypothetical protein